MIMYPVAIFLLNPSREIRDEGRDRGLSDISLSVDTCMRFIMWIYTFCLVLRMVFVNGLAAFYTGALEINNHT